MTEPKPSFVPEPPDPEREALDEKMAELLAEILVRHIIRKGLLKSNQPPSAPCVLEKTSPSECD